MTSIRDCPTCNGTGIDETDALGECYACGGFGGIEDDERDGYECIDCGYDPCECDTPEPGRE